jgi:ectoine hydroxylase-related dioxygenase (phytanoyl-CoA dioxygenase family)
MLDNILAKTLARLFSRAADPAPSDEVGAASATAAQKQFFEENGYLILPGLFSPAAVAGMKAHLDHLWATRAEQNELAIDAYFSMPQAARIYFRKAAAEVRDFPYKLLDLHLEDATVRDMCTDTHLVTVLRNLLGAQPLVCNSLLFEKGSQQEAHFDTFFMPSATKNMMAASWIALDPVTETNGPLYYYPKSHLIEPYKFSHGKINAIFSELQTGAAAHIDHIIEQYGLKREIFLPKAGDVLIWHAQLLHGGSPILNAHETRTSLVTHYWTELDFPNPDQRLEIGDGRWILKRAHQYVIDEDIFREIDAFLATIDVSDEERAAMPDSLDAHNYLARNQDVLRARVNPFVHYRDHGQREGRLW